MKRTALLLIFLAGCASAPSKIAKPQIDLIQLYAPSDGSFRTGGGRILAEFGLRITNNAREPITLSRIQLGSIGQGGYTLQPEDRGYKQVIESGEVAAVKMTAHAFYTSDMSGSPSKEPVLLRAVVYFQAPSGPFRQVVTRQVEQFSQGPR